MQLDPNQLLALRHMGYEWRMFRAMFEAAGPYWGGSYIPAATTITAVGTADFYPTAASRATFSYDINGIVGSKTIERFAFQ